MRNHETKKTQKKGNRRITWTNNAKQQREEETRKERAGTFGMHFLRMNKGLLYAFSENEERASLFIFCFCCLVLVVAIDCLFASYFRSGTWPLK